MAKYYYFAHYYSHRGRGNGEFVSDGPVTTSDQLFEAKRQLAEAAGLPEVTIETVYFLRTDDPQSLRVLEAEIPGARFVYFISYHYVDDDGCTGIGNIECAWATSITRMSTIRNIEAIIAVNWEFVTVSIVTIKLLREDLALPKNRGRPSAITE